MNFTSIGAWLDSKIDGAQNSWRGSEARKTIDRIMERSRSSFQETYDKVSIGVEKAGSNLKTNLKIIDEKNEGKGFLRKAFEVGKQGGLIGLMYKKPEEIQEKPAETVSEQPKTTNLPMQQHDGWNIAS